MKKFKEFVNCYLDAWRNYHGFSGRASRKDYWGFVLINFLVNFVILLVEAILGMDDGFISSLYSLAAICPSLALCARRLHDTGRSGWWQLGLIVPLLCFYPLYLLWFKAGSNEVNKYGAPVTAAAAEAVYGEYSVPVENEFSSYEMCPAPQVAAPEKAKCAHCGTVLEDGAKFCSECGAPSGK